MFHEFDLINKFLVELLETNFVSLFALCIIFHIPLIMFFSSECSVGIVKEKVVTMQQRSEVNDVVFSKL